MSATILYIIYAGLFVSVLLLIEGGYFLIQDQFGLNRDVNRRMKMIRRGRNKRAALSLIRNETEQGGAKIVRWIAPAVIHLLWTAGVTIPTSRMIAMCVAAIFAVTIIARGVLSLPLPIAVGLAVLVGIGVPWTILSIMAGKRQKKFSRQLPVAIDLVVRGLEAGHPVTAALSLVAKEMPDPIGTEFGIAVDEMTYGLTMNASLENMTRRFPNADLKYLVISIQIQKDTGGNLVVILSKLSDTIRKRFNMYAKIRAVSSEGRLAGIVVGSMPFVVGSVILLANPDYFGIVQDDPWFVPMLATSAALLMIGTFVIWRIVQIRI